MTAPPALQECVASLASDGELAVYFECARKCLIFLADIPREQCVTASNYFFFRFNLEEEQKLSRPVNSNLFSANIETFDSLRDDIGGLLQAIRDGNRTIDGLIAAEHAPDRIDTAVYTVQQSLGCVLDTLTNTNRARKLVGEIFERLIRQLLGALGLVCEARKLALPIPDTNRRMNYQLDLVFSKNPPEDRQNLVPGELVGSVKTTSKDRIDKVFLDKFMLERLLARPVPVLGVFLHDVQRKKARGTILGLGSTFKTNHFIGYSKIFVPLDGVYYVDRRDHMMDIKDLAQRIRPLSRLISEDLWQLMS